MTALPVGPTYLGSFTVTYPQLFKIVIDMFLESLKYYLDNILRFFLSNITTIV